MSQLVSNVLVSNLMQCFSTSVVLGCMDFNNQNSPDQVTEEGHKEA